MATTNTGEFRRSFVIRTTDAGGATDFYGNPITATTVTTFDLKLAFTGNSNTYALITDSELALLSDPVYEQRRDDFFTIIPDITPAEIASLTSTSTGTDLISCPIVP